MLFIAGDAPPPWEHLEGKRVHFWDFQNVLLNILSSSINNRVDIESSTHSKQVSQISYEKVASQWKQCSMYEQEVPQEAAAAWTRVRIPQRIGNH